MKAIKKVKTEEDNFNEIIDFFQKKAQPKKTKSEPKSFGRREAEELYRDLLFEPDFLENDVQFFSSFSAGAGKLRKTPKEVILVNNGFGWIEYHDSLRNRLDVTIEEMVRYKWGLELCGDPVKFFEKELERLKIQRCKRR